jgi:hypothetical protein
MSIRDRGFVQQAIRDTEDLVDVAYLSLYMVMIITVGGIPVLFLMAMLDWAMCYVDCKFPLLELGQAAGLMCAAFAAALGALGVYMAATRKPAHDQIQNVDAPNARSVSQTTGDNTK